MMIQAPANRALSGRERAALCVMFLASLVIAPLALPGASPGQREPLAIVFPPWVSADEAITRSLSAGYPVLRSGRSSFVVIAAPVEAASAVRPQGAVLVLTLAGLAGCLDAAATEPAAS
ncbi:MAG TPA: hypothetical protein VGN82_20900 [Bosea sp. (in: a-proteobacteria)]|jgi:hypothetical protein|uniref:hypothetical protein n=1 Tax=Bosea sp. (in: a-proteobacteria) TaxID=1871050 RepID=UPI002E1362EE|nr:hypothetical protein [Bosea sp. (in: a-proteobacteria)]